MGGSTSQRRRQILVTAGVGLATTVVVPAPLILLLGLIADGSGNPARDVLLALSFTATLGLSAGLLCGISMGNYDRPVLAGILSGIAALLATVACVVGLADAGAGWFLLPVFVATSGVAGFALGHLIRFLARRDGARRTPTDDK